MAITTHLLDGLLDRHTATLPALAGNGVRWTLMAAGGASAVHYLGRSFRWLTLPHAGSAAEGQLREGLGCVLAAAWIAGCLHTNRSGALVNARSVQAVQTGVSLMGAAGMMTWVSGSDPSAAQAVLGITAAGVTGAALKRVFAGLAAGDLMRTGRDSGNVARRMRISARRAWCSFGWGFTTHIGANILGIPGSVSALLGGSVATVNLLGTSPMAREHAWDLLKSSSPRLYQRALEIFGD